MSLNVASVVYYSVLHSTYFSKVVALAVTDSDNLTWWGQIGFVTHLIVTASLAKITATPKSAHFILSGNFSSKLARIALCFKVILDKNIHEVFGQQQDLPTTGNGIKPSNVLGDLDC